jgi:SSS family solute:Na+ symporter
MIRLLGTADILVFTACLLLLLASSLRTARRNASATGYFMAGRTLRWWSVAGSIYGTNVSLSQIIGMLGIGYSIGFAQSHYELLAIPAILVLARLFVPVYRRGGFYTLSQYLAERYDDRARLLYTLAIMAVILILLVGGLYIGSRQLGLLFRDTPVQPTYLQGILLIAGLSCALTLFGGMEAVVAAENIITVLMVLAVVTVGWCTLSQPAIGGFGGLLDLDASPVRGRHQMRLYLPSDHPDLPWTGVFSGLLVLHGFFWTTNQFEVQRVLAARSDRDAQLGAIAAGFLKLTIPFFSISAGVAAAYLFRDVYGMPDVKPDDAFIVLLSQVVPAGYGLLGLILAGFTGAVFSSIYAMLNSASTIASVDIYRRYLRPDADDRRMVVVGRASVAALSLLAALLAWASFDPASEGNFFLTLSRNTSYLKPGIVSAFLLGVVWKRTHPASAAPAILAAPFLGLLIEAAYARWLASDPFWHSLFGARLNFMHRVFVVFLLCLALQTAMTLRSGRRTQPGTGPAIHGGWRRLATLAAAHTILLTAVLAGLTDARSLSLPAAGITLLVMAGRHGLKDAVLGAGGLLAGATAWALYFFA